MNNSKRQAFGKSIGDHGGLAFQLADSEIDIKTSRLFIWNTAWLLDQGEEARNESSMSKVFCSEAAFRIVDRAMQTLGGMGITDDTLVERLFREMMIPYLAPVSQQLVLSYIAEKALGLPKSY